MAERSMKDGKLLREISDLTARIKELEQSESALRRTEHESAILAEIGWLISSTLDIEEVYEQFTAAVRKLITCDRISIDLNNPAEETFTITYVSGVDIPDRRPGDVIPLKGSISEIILRTRTGLLIHPTSIQDVTTLFPGAINISTICAGMRSLISVPLVSRDQVIGTLHLRAIQPNAYTNRDLRLAERIGVQIAGAIASAELFKDLQNTETTLRDSEARLQSILDNSGILVFLKDLEGRYIMVNRRFEELFHVTRQAVVGKSDHDLFSQEYADKFRQHDLLALEKGAPFETEEFVPQDGTRHIYISVKFPLFRADGKPYAVCGIATDITERKRVEQEIALLAEIGRLISSTPDINEVYEQVAIKARQLIPLDRLVVNLNRPGEGTVLRSYMHGLDIPGRKQGDTLPLARSINESLIRTRKGLIIQSISPAEIAEHYPSIASTFQAGIRSMMSVPLIARDEVVGGLHVQSMKPDCYDAETLRLAERIGMQIAGAIANSQLFNELSRTEKSLRESNQLFSLFMHHSPIYAYIKEVTPAGSRILQASENFRVITGIPGSAMTGRTMTELFPPEFAAKTVKDDWAVVSNGQVLTLDEELNGRSYTTIKFPIVLGEKTLLAGYSIDVTEQKRTEAELIRAQKLESLGVLAGGIAHDFNNLMTVVQGYLDLVLMDLPSEHASHQRLRAAMQCVENTKELTSQFITFSRGGGPVLELLDVREVIRDAVHRIIKETNIRVRFDFAKNLRLPEIDEHQIRQCFYNLATNAVEAMPGGGNLTIRAQNVDIPNGDALPLAEGPYITITFADDGPGILEEHLVKVFDPYFTTKKMGGRKGMGLGLSICYFVLKQHGGHISVESRPGKGASFSLYLPVRGCTSGRRKDSTNGLPLHGPYTGQGW
ncbi:MAG: PAS domain-containing protein [Syntrophales bacterium]